MLERAESVMLLLHGSFESCNFPSSSFIKATTSRLIVIVWQPLEDISAPSFKTMGDREKVLQGNM